MTDQVNARISVDNRYTSSPRSVEQAQRATNYTNYHDNNNHHHYDQRSEVSYYDDDGREDNVNIQVQSQGQGHSEKFREARAAMDNIRRKSSQIKKSAF